MKSFEELKQQDQVDAEEALKLSMEEHLKATGNVHNLKASEIGSTLPQWNANKILGNPVRFVSDKDGNTLQYNEKEQSFDLKPTPKLEFLGEGDIKVSKVGEKVVIKSDVSKSDTVVGLKHAISTKAPSVHEHKDYVLKGDLNSKLLKLSEDKSSKNHSHNNYVTFPVIEKLKGELDKSLEIGLSKKAERNHKHDLKIPTFKKEFGKIEKDINTLQEVVGVVGDKSNLVTKADLKIAVSEVVSLPVKKHEHTDYAKVIEIDKLKKTITELKIVDKKGNNKAIEDLLAYKAERNHAHSVTEIQGLSSTLSALGTTYLKIDGSNYMTSTTKITNLNADLLDGADLSIDGTFASNSDVLIPSEKAVKTYVGTVASNYLRTDGSNSMTGTLTSTVITGTTPFTIASTTKVSNLNVDSIDGADLSTDGTFASNSDVLIPTQKATKTYVDGLVSPFQYVTRTMAGTPTGEYADIGYWTTTYGAHNLRVTLSLNVNGVSIAKQYLLSTAYNQTNGAWQIVPVSKNTGYYGFDFHLIAYQNNAILQLRIICFRNNNAATLPIKVRMENCGDSSDTFTSVATSGTMTVPNALVTSSTDYHAIGGGYMFTRAIPAGVGSYIEMCSLSGVNGNGATEMWVSNVDNGFVVSKKYMIPGTYSYAPNWCILVPITETGAYSGNDFAVVAIQNSASITMRLLKTSGGGTGTAIITLSSGGDYASFFNEYSGTGTMAVPTIYHPGTSIQQFNNNTFIRGALNLVYLALTSARTLDATDYLVNCTSGSFAVTLPTAVGFSGKLYNIKNSGTGIISICTTSSQTLDAGNSKLGNPILNQYDEIEVMSNGANWVVKNRTNNNEVYNNEEILSYADETVYL